MNGLSTALLSTSQGRRPRHPWLDATSRHRYCRGRVSLPAGDLSARSVNLTHSQNYRFRYGRPVPYILISHNRKRRAQGPPLHYYIYFSKKKTAHECVRSLCWRYLSSRVGQVLRPKEVPLAPGEESVRWTLSARISIWVKRKPHTFVCGVCWRYLSSRAVARQVLSAQMSLTSVFGMGTGGPSLQSTPTHMDGF